MTRLIPASIAALAESRTANDMTAPLSWTLMSERVFFGLPSPSFNKSQFMPSIRASGWQLAQLCQCWKQIVASLKSIFPRRCASSIGLGPKAICPQALRRIGLQIHDGDRIGKIFRNVSAGTDHRHAVRTVAFELDPPPQIHEEGEVVVHVGRWG